MKEVAFGNLIFAAIGLIIMHAFDGRVAEIIGWIIMAWAVAGTLAFAFVVPRLKDDEDE